MTPVTIITKHHYPERPVHDSQAPRSDSHLGAHRRCKQLADRSDQPGHLVGDLARVALGPHEIFANVPEGVSLGGGQAGLTIQSDRLFVYVNDELVLGDRR